MAYASKYYDPVKAHEYYMKHRKLKGKTKRGSTAALNEEGKAAAAEVKEKIKEELKAALAKLPKRGATEEKKKLREEYAEKYYAELEKMKADPAFSKIAKGSTRQSGGGAKSSTASSSNKGSTSSSKAEANTQQTQAKEKQKKTRSQKASEAFSAISGLLNASAGLSESEMSQMAPRVKALISKAENKLGRNLKVGDNAESVSAAMNAINMLSSQYVSLPAETRSLLRPHVQSVIDRISEKLGISSTDIGEKVSKVEAEKSAKQRAATERKAKRKEKNKRAKVTYSRTT